MKSIAARIRHGHPVVPLMLACLPVATLLFIPKGIIDDSYITFRYAWNFAHGAGLVFNPGERVEGYTNFLWVALTALAFPFHLPIGPFAFALAAACGLAAGGLVYAVARAEGASRWTAYVGMIAFAGCVDYWRTVSFALEGGLLSLTLMLTFRALQLGKGKLAGLGAGGLFLIRPEFAAFLPIHLIARLLCRAGWRREDRSGWTVGIWFGMVAAMTAFRRLYFGAWLPNTMTAKAVDLSDHSALEANLELGWRYMTGFAADNPSLCAGLLAGAAFGLLRRDAGLLTFFGAFLFECLVVLVNGGDWMTNFRLLAVFAPVMAVFLAVSLDRLGRWIGGAGFVLAFFAVGATLFGVQQNRFVVARPQPFVSEEDGCYSALIPRLRAVIQPGDRLSLDALGLVGYLLIDNYAYDMWGLTDRETALHGRYGRQMGRSWPSYDFEVIRPDIVIAHGSPWYFSEMEAASHGDYSALYDTYRLDRIPTCPYSTMFIGFRKAHAARLLPAIEDLGPLAISVSGR